MNFKRTLWLVVLALVHLPVMALAGDLETFSCGTIYPFWWRYDGPRTELSVRCMNVQPMGDSFLVTFSVENQGAAVFEEMGFTLTHTAVKQARYADPTSPAPPVSPYAQLGTEALEHGTLPSLRPGDHVVMQAYARGFSPDANHIISVIFHDKGQIEFDPQPGSRYWLRILSPRDTPDALALSAGKVERLGSTITGYVISRVSVTLRNVSQSVLPAGTPISLVHGSNSPAGGYWGPDDLIDPNDPGNPYASFFREVMFQGQLQQPLHPGEELELEGMAHEPEGVPALNQLTVDIGG